MSAPERIVYQGDIEHEIERISGLLETATGQLATAAEDAANAEADYRVKYAQAFYSPTRFRPIDADTKLTEKIREALATDICSEELRTYKVASARSRALEEKCRQLREQLGALRTLSANVRVQT